MIQRNIKKTNTNLNIRSTIKRTLIKKLIFENDILLNIALCWKIRMGPAIVLEGNLMTGKMLKLWLPTTGILVVIRRIYLYQFKCKYLKKQKLLLQIYCIFKIYIKFWTAWNKKKTKKNKKKKKKLATELKKFWNYWHRKTWLFKWIKDLVSGNFSVVNVLTSPKSCRNLRERQFYSGLSSFWTKFR